MNKEDVKGFIGNLAYEMQVETLLEYGFSEDDPDNTSIETVTLRQYPLNLELDLEKATFYKKSNHAKTLPYSTPPKELFSYIEQHLRKEIEMTKKIMAPSEPPKKKKPRVGLGYMDFAVPVGGNAAAADFRWEAPAWGGIEAPQEEEVERLRQDVVDRLNEFAAHPAEEVRQRRQRVRRPDGNMPDGDAPVDGRAVADVEEEGPRPMNRAVEEVVREFAVRGINPEGVPGPDGPEEEILQEAGERIDPEPLRFGQNMRVENGRVFVDNVEIAAVPNIVAEDQVMAEEELAGEELVAEGEEEPDVVVEREEAHEPEAVAPEPEPRPQWNIFDDVFGDEMEMGEEEGPVGNF